VDKDAELIAPQSSYQDVVPDDAAQASRHDPQHLVTDAVTIKVIYGLEVIEVDDEYGAAVRPSGRFKASQFLQEGAPVWQAGERVMSREVMGLIFSQSAQLYLAMGLPQPPNGIEEAREP
jgi:hypothetical protein